MSSLIYSNNLINLENLLESLGPKVELQLGQPELTEIIKPRKSSKFSKFMRLSV